MSESGFKPFRFQSPHNTGSPNNLHLYVTQMSPKLVPLTSHPLRQCGSERLVVFEEDYRPLCWHEEVGFHGSRQHHTGMNACMLLWGHKFVPMLWRFLLIFSKAEDVTTPILFQGICPRKTHVPITKRYLHGHLSQCIDCSKNTEAT